jgi:hypothetical protein
LIACATWARRRICHLCFVHFLSIDPQHRQASIATILFAIDGRKRLFLCLGLALTVHEHNRDGRRRTLSRSGG